MLDSWPAKCISIAELGELQEVRSSRSEVRWGNRGEREKLAISETRGHPPAGPSSFTQLLTREGCTLRAIKAPSSTKTRHVVRCVLADRTRMDCQLLATSLRRTSSHCKVVGTAASVAETLAVLKKHQPEVGLVSPYLAEGPLAGFDLVQEMREPFPGTRAIMLLDSMEPRMVIYSFQVGAKGIFSRD
jgi:hypothetical protein